MSEVEVMEMSRPDEFFHTSVDQCMIITVFLETQKTTVFWVSRLIWIFRHYRQLSHFYDLTVAEPHCSQLGESMDVL